MANKDQAIRTYVKLLVDAENRVNELTAEIRELETKCSYEKDLSWKVAMKQRIKQLTEKRSCWTEKKEDYLQMIIKTSKTLEESTVQ